MLEELDEGSVVLDVGVGTASALVKHRALLQKKNIRVIGIDNDDGYVKAAKFNVGYASIENQIRIYRQDVRLMNDLKGQIVLPHGSQVGFKSQEKEVKFDAIMFSVDHGDLITEYEANKMFAKIRKKCKLKTAKHEVIENSIDNALEAAYFTVLEYDPNNQGDKQEENKKNSKKNRSKSPLKHDKKEKEDTKKANNRNRSKSPTKHKR
ncbi:Methyltransferase domain [Seminavis robusta]|uniref:Methyltransferase domain n=1 Tax=Seminavis robusta TaxID=568900 RepID=A0A9N8EEQ1_9STRA|nr:Methyltransferase domain [Seminavis robusta]|eukprot:Sro1015_g231560.1 Methyltransferase domain (208) ;mRNA; r:29388-30246